MNRQPKTAEIELIPLFMEFVSASKSGKRLKRDGSVFSSGTIESYSIVLKELSAFQSETGFYLRIRVSNKLSSRQLAVEKRYWERFYRKYTDHLYAIGVYDNYVGSHIKIIKTFFSYLKHEKLLAIGEFYRNFYIRSEKVPIIVFTQEQLKFLISDNLFTESLPAHLRQAKDVLVFGSTVGLRYSDLSRLTRTNLEKVHGHTYLKVRSVKTKTETVVKLPDYALEILAKYKGLKTLLPMVSKGRMNKNIKEICQLAGWTHVIGKSRSRKGRSRAVKAKQGPARFCDLVTTHTMRKTAITTLLILGVPEQVVRKISGHAIGSKEFYKYVHFSQHYIDTETDLAFRQLRN